MRPHLQLLQDKVQSSPGSTVNHHAMLISEQHLATSRISLSIKSLYYGRQKSAAAFGLFAKHCPSMNLNLNHYHYHYHLIYR